MKMDIVSVDILPRCYGLAVKIRLEDPKDPVKGRASFKGGKLGAVVASQIVGTEAHYVITEENHVRWFFNIRCQIKEVHVYTGGDTGVDIEVLGQKFWLDVPDEELIDSLVLRVGESVKMRVGTEGDGFYFFDRIVE